MRDTIENQKHIILDYKMNLPRHLRSPQPEYQAKALLMENTLKNMVMKKLSEIREIRDKPSLKDMINDYLKK